MQLSDEHLEIFAAFIGFTVSPKTPIALTRNRVARAEQQSSKVRLFREAFERDIKIATESGDSDTALLLWKCFKVAHAVMFAVYDMPVGTQCGPIVGWGDWRRLLGVLMLQHVDRGTDGKLRLTVSRQEVADLKPMHSGDYYTGGGAVVTAAGDPFELPVDRLVAFHPLESNHQEDLVRMIRDQEFGEDG